MTTPTNPPATPADQTQQPPALPPGAEAKPKGRGGRPSAAAKRAAAAAEAARAAAEEAAEAEPYELPEAWRNQPGADLLLETCEEFGVDPDQTLPIFNPAKHKPTAKTRFRELMNYRFDGGNDNAGELPSVTLVTAGGVKLRRFEDGTFDPETEARLRQIFRAVRKNPKTGEMENLPLPEDLTLPAPSVVGFTSDDGHVYRRGWLNRDRAKD